jgi:putative methionine-R-sulfoxide reductase with GAF domain
MSSSESFFQLTVEGSLQLINLIERALKAPSFKDFADDVFPGITQVMQTSKTFLFIADPQLSALHFAQQGFQPEVASKIKTWCIEGFEQICYKTDFPQFPESFYSEGEVFPDFMLHLLRDDAKYIGLIGLNANEGTARISPDVLAGILKLLAKVANRVSERAELEKQLSYLNTYLSISSMLTQSLDLHELLETALNCSMQAVSEDKGVAGSVLQARRPEMINDLHSDPRFLNEFDSQTGFRTRNMIAIPLLAGEEAVGVLEVLNSAHNRRNLP